MIVPLCQVLKVNQGCKGPLDVQGLMAPKEKEETLAPEACVDLKVKLRGGVSLYQTAIRHNMQKSNNYK